MSTYFFLNEVLTFHVLSAISILNSFFFLGRQGVSWQCEIKCPGDNSHLKKWFKIQNAWEFQHKQIFIFSFASYGAGNNFTSSFLFMRLGTVKYVALAIGSFLCTATVQGDKDYLCNETLQRLNSTPVLITTFFKPLTVSTSSADLALLRKQPINFTINLQLVVNPAHPASCFLPLYVFSYKAAIN